MSTDCRYTVDAGQEFAWSSVTGALDLERMQVLDKHLIGPRVLDAGCGGGAYVDHLSRKGLHVTGIDAHEPLLQHARERGLAGEFVQADLNEPLNFPDKAFDSTYCFDVLEHIDDEIATAELVRVTRKRLIIAVPAKDERRHKYGLTYYPYLDPTHLRYYTEQSLRRLLCNAGARHVTICQHISVPLHALLAEQCSIRSRWPLVTPIYRQLFSFLLPRIVTPAWYLNWMAVADL